MDKRWPVVALVALGVSGSIKGSSQIVERVPADLTLICAVLVGAAIYDAALGRTLGQSWDQLATWPAVGVVLLGILGAWQAPTVTEYVAAKSISFFALTLGCCTIGSLLLVRTATQRAALAWATVAFGLVVVLLAATGEETGRSSSALALVGDSTIGPARVAGAALVALLLLTAARRVRLVLAAPLAFALLQVVIDTGSRGPLVATVVAVGLAALTMTRGRTAARTLVAAGALAVGGLVAYANAAPLVQRRFALLFQPDKGASVRVRESFYSESWRHVQERPLGGGWGSLEAELSPRAAYPHNILLEIAAEAGWVTAAGFVIACGVALRATWRAGREGEASSIVVFALLIFWLLNGMVSGDVNDNRALFIVLGAALTVGHQRRRGGPRAIRGPQSRLPSARDPDGLGSAHDEAERKALKSLAEQRFATDQR